MITLASSLSAASLSAASARAGSAPSISMSNTLPWRTLAMPATPSDLSAPSIALPWGSSTPGLRVTVTRAFIAAAVPFLHLSPEGRGSPRGAAATFLAGRGGLPLHEHGARALGALVLAHDAEALGDLGIGFEQSAEVAAEAVLVELLVRLDVPQPAGIGRDLVGHDDPHHLVLPQPAALHLEVDQPDADAEEEARQEVVDADGERHDVVDLLRRRPAERGDVLLRHHRVVERVVLVIELDDRSGQLRALSDAAPLP